jgi:F420-dependent oxidoreductase-like protein
MEMAQLNAGLVVRTFADVRQTLDVILEADERGVGTVWQTVGTTRPDPVTVYAAAATTTRSVKLGTAIVPTYPRHPGALASQVLAVEGLAPGRLRLGIGPSHVSTIEQSLGLPMGKPLTHLREYHAVLRSLFDTGSVSFHGQYLNVEMTFQAGTTPPRAPVYFSALSVNAFRLAGEVSDGAISWVSPVPYLVKTGLPALAEGAAKAGRQAPPLIAHVPVAVTTDREAALAATARDFGSYGSYPFYAKMFEAAGYPVQADGTSTPEAIEELAVSGTPDEIRSQLEAILAQGIGEVLVSHVAVNDEDAERSELIGILAG